MPELDQPRLSVELELTGEFISTGIESYSITSDFLTPTDGWEFVVYSETDPAGLRRKFRPLQPVKLYIDGQCQVIGRIDRISGTGESGKALRVEGRDYLADLVDGGIDPTLRFPKGTDLGAAVLQIFKPWGIDTVFGSNLTRNVLTGKSRFSGQSAGRDFKASKLEDYKPSENQGAWETFDKIAARHGYTGQPCGRRNEIALVAPDYSSDVLYPLRRGAGGNVLSAQCMRDYSKVPTVTIATGRQGASGEKASGTRNEVSTFGPNAPSPIGKNREVRSIVYSADGSTPAVIDFRFNPKHAAAGNAGLLYRPMFYSDKESRNQEQLDRGIRRMIAERLKDTLTYRCTVRGHRSPETGALYTVDTLASVVDEVEDISETLWIMSRTFENSGAGVFTHLEMIRPMSLVL